MPASRVAFAIGDLMKEIRSLLPRDAEIFAELTLDVAAYAKLKGEIEHNYSTQIKTTEVACADPGQRIEFFTLGGLRIVGTLNTGKVDA